MHSVPNVRLSQEGLTKGQISFTNQIDNVAKIAFPYSDPRITASEAIRWTLLVFSILLAFVPGLGPAATVARGIGAIAGGGSEAVSTLTAECVPFHRIDRRLLTIEAHSLNNYPRRCIRSNRSITILRPSFRTQEKP
ncbi:hypothetical protein P152DRAFT_106218 [Eremomyces bilateralis CBS 781.70]|uniref:Uncharacterized protein n=1 Tax=Eremomyces bilateralis CBS 781.70 TaxID=1392243 RepID=A0A6G1FX57_9PEZI|nr:uncharacterized protein P152DRAFT_106218 [Eremomyces bilateralis CBS 781.70]KAF1810260.1 hypothetical protein P152DRAFT_106218 [Eremomyces bilateralis CBS 781.70]